MGRAQPAFRVDLRAGRFILSPEQVHIETNCSAPAVISFQERLIYFNQLPKVEHWHSLQFFWAYFALALGLQFLVVSAIGGTLKHIQNKNDWFYEFRPQIILAFGIIGLFSKLLVSYGNEPIWFKVSVACGIFLVVMSLKIMSWRREYRAAYRRIPTR